MSLGSGGAVQDDRTDESDRTSSRRRRHPGWPQRLTAKVFVPRNAEAVAACLPSSPGRWRGGEWSFGRPARVTIPGRHHGDGLLPTESLGLGLVLSGSTRAWPLAFRASSPRSRFHSRIEIPPFPIDPNNELTTLLTQDRLCDYLASGGSAVRSIGGGKVERQAVLSRRWPTLASEPKTFDRPCGVTGVREANGPIRSGANPFAHGRL